QNIGVFPGAFIEEPEKPVVADSTFMGWYSDATFQTQFDFSQPLTQNATAYAKWFQNIYILEVWPATGNPQRYRIKGLQQKYETITIKIYIPSYLGGLPIDWINDVAFKNYKTIIELYIEDGVCSTRNRVFQICYNIVTLRLPNTLRPNADNAF